MAKEKVDYKDFFKSLVKFNKSEKIFLSIVIFLEAIFLSLSYYLGNNLSLDSGSAILSQLKNYSGIVSILYYSFIFYLYYRITKCSETSLYKVIVQYFIIEQILFLPVLVYLGTSMLHLPIVEYFFYNLFKTISLLISTLVISLGLVSLCYSKKINLKEIGIIFLAAIIIFFIPGTYNLYKGTYNFHKHIAILIYMGIKGIGLFYGVDRIKDYVKTKKNSGFVTFLVLGGAIFCFEYLNGLFGTLVQDTTGGVGLFLINFDALIFYIIWGLFYYIYKNKDARKRLKEEIFY